MKKMFIPLTAILLCTLLAGCFVSEPRPQASPEPSADAYASRPEFKTDKLDEANPMLKVYDVKREKLMDMRLEEYLEGVLAGEMPGDWPIEALKAQAILARTFVCKFIDEKQSRYEGADISTDIREAQAYSHEGITDAIRRAVSDTQGEIMVWQGELPYAWFYAHGGGKTALAREGLEFAGDEPGYTQVVDSRDSDEAPEDVKSWSCSFSKDELIEAARKTGAKISDVSSVKIGKRGPSGRALTLDIDGTEVSAPELRIALGSEKMKSTMLSECSFSDGRLRMSGTGYGHGVGMSQWGAYALAKEGMSAQEIVEYYFKEVEIASL